jgi:hypothetical protein
MTSESYHNPNSRLEALRAENAPSGDGWVFQLNHSEGSFSFFRKGGFVALFEPTSEDFRRVGYTGADKDQVRDASTLPPVLLANFPDLRGAEMVRTQAGYAARDKEFAFGRKAFSDDPDNPKELRSTRPLYSRAYTGSTNPDPISNN